MNVFASNEEGTEVLAISEPVLASYRIDRDTLASKARENFQDKVWALVAVQWQPAHCARAGLAPVCLLMGY